MAIYREKGVHALADSEPTQKFKERIDRLAKAMNSGSAKGALFPNCQEEKVMLMFQLLLYPKAGACLSLS